MTCPHCRDTGRLCFVDIPTDVYACKCSPPLGQQYVNGQQYRYALVEPHSGELRAIVQLKADAR